MYRQPPHQRISRSYVFPWHHPLQAVFWLIVDVLATAMIVAIGLPHRVRLMMARYRLERAYLKPSSGGEQ